MINQTNLFLSLGESPAFDPAATFTITATSPGINNIVNITNISGGIAVVLPGQTISGALMPYGAQVMPYGTSGTSGVGGTGTYALSTTIDNIVTSETMQVTYSQFGQAGQGTMLYDPNTHYLYNRNTANTAWNLLGNISIVNLGLLPRSGGALSSALTGSNGLLTTDGNTPLIAPPYVNSKASRAATMADIASLQTTLVGQINTQINAAIQQIGLPGLRSNITIGYGTLGTVGGASVVYYPIPVTGLTYADGTLVQTSDCVGFAAINNWNSPASGPYMYTYCQPKPGTTNGMSWAAFAIGYLGATYSFSMNYIVIAIKPTA